jgi:hypothetical protein
MYRDSANQHPITVGSSSSLRVTAQCFASWPNGSTRWGLEPTVTSITARRPDRAIHAPNTQPLGLTYVEPHNPPSSTGGSPERRPTAVTPIRGPTPLGSARRPPVRAPPTRGAATPAPSSAHHGGRRVLEQRTRPRVAVRTSDSAAGNIVALGGCTEPPFRVATWPAEPRRQPCASLASTSGEAPPSPARHTHACNETD